MDAACEAQGHWQVIEPLVTSCKVCRPSGRTLRRCLGMLQPRLQVQHSGIPAVHETGESWTGLIIAGRVKNSY